MPTDRVVLDWNARTDDEFLDDLLPVSPALQAAQDARADDPAAARAHVVAHFLGRAAPRWPFDHRAEPASAFWSRNFFFGGEIQREWMDRALDYEFYDYNASGNYHRLTPEVDWDRGRVRELGSAGWLTLTFGYWGLFTAAGYAVTREAAYADVFLRCFDRWLEDFPTQATDRGLDAGGNINTNDPSFIDSCMIVGRRTMVMTDALYSGILGAMPTDDAFRVLKYIWHLASILDGLYADRHARDRYRSGNHVLFDWGVSQFVPGVMYPEFAFAAHSAAEGGEMIRMQAADPEHGCIRPDGTTWEASARYGWYAAGMFQQAVELARLNDVDLLPPESEARVLRFLDSFVDLTTPDGSIVPYGDCQPPPGMLHLTLAPTLVTNSRSAWLMRRRGLDLPAHAPAVRTERTPRKDDETPSRHLPDSGLVLVRTGWGERDSLLSLHGNPRSGYSGHSHDDYTSFQLWADGAPLFVDTATWAYRIDEIVPAERRYHYAAFSHNMLTVEGYRPAEVFARMGDVHDWWGDHDGHPTETTITRTIEGARGEVVMEHANFPGMVVRRTCAFDLGARELTVTDAVRADAAQPRTFRQWLHPWFGADARMSGDTELVVNTDGVHAVCDWEASEAIAARVEPSAEVERAARVFGFGAPMRAFAECRTDAPEFEVTCRVRWSVNER